MDAVKNEQGIDGNSEQKAEHDCRRLEFGGGLSVAEPAFAIFYIWPWKSMAMSDCLDYQRPIA
jgi:hypothetical protein